MKTRAVSEELLNKILNYLANKPYIEVVELIRELIATSEIKEIEKKAGEVKK